MCKYSKSYGNARVLIKVDYSDLPGGTQPTNKDKTLVLESLYPSPFDRGNWLLHLETRRRLY